MFEKAVLSVEDPKRFDAVRGQIASAFSSTGASTFLKSLAHSNLRVRNFEAVLAANKLGASALSEYRQLGNADQGQIREFYLASLEQVAPDLRQKFFKLYAYY